MQGPLKSAFASLLRDRSCVRDSLKSAFRIRRHPAELFHNRDGHSVLYIFKVKSGNSSKELVRMIQHSDDTLALYLFSSNRQPL